MDINEVREELVGKSLKFKGEELTITAVDEKTAIVRRNNDLYADIKVICDNGKSIALITAVESGGAIVDEDTYNYLKIISPDIYELTKLARLEEEKRKEEERIEREEKKKADEDRKAKEKEEKHVMNCINAFRTADFRRLDEDTIEWLRSHIKSIKAVIPDFLEKEFTTVYPGQPYKVVDTKSKRTTGGYLMQLNASFKITIDKKFEAEMPIELQNIAKGNIIQNNGLVRKLIRDYDFNFS